MLSEEARDECTPDIDQLIQTSQAIGKIKFDLITVRELDVYRIDYTTIYYYFNNS
jgi:hypothetical protein